jgi:hypothetical protein
VPTGERDTIFNWEGAALDAAPATVVDPFPVGAVVVRYLVGDGTLRFPDLGVDVTSTSVDLAMDQHLVLQRDDRDGYLENVQSTGAGVLDGTGRDMWVAAGSGSERLRLMASTAVAYGDVTVSLGP